MALIACPDCKREVSDSAQSCLGCGLPLAAVRGSPSPQGGERVYFQDARVTVTGARAMLGGTTYAMANITSVKEFVEIPSPAAAILGTILVLAGIALVVDSSGGSGFGWTLLLAGAACVAFWWFLINTQYWVRIGTAGAEANAIASNDAAWTRKVVAAMNEAIVGRG